MSVYIICLFSVITASFKVFFIISFLIIIHELGHAFGALLLKVKIREIHIYPLGAITKIDMPLNISSLKEFIILILGPTFQIIAYVILVTLTSNKELIKVYHYGILIFNLLPISPLDGGKILRIVIERFVSLKKSLYISVYISYLLLVIILVVSYQKKVVTLNIITMIIFSAYLVVKEMRDIDIKYNKFILERYLNNYNFKNSALITNINNMFRDKKHIIKDKDRYYLEKDYLDKLYNKRKNS